MVCCLAIWASAGTSGDGDSQIGTIVSEWIRFQEWLAECGCTHVVIESTGGYWKPVFNILEEQFVVVLAHTQEVKNRGGHKTDGKDSQWLAHLLRHGMIRPSFIPSRAIRKLPDLT